MSVTIDVVWIGNWFNEHVQVVTTSHCSAIANSYTLQFTTARIKAFQSAVSSQDVVW
jgi:hypothetical protein